MRKRQLLGYSGVSPPLNFQKKFLVTQKTKKIFFFYFRLLSNLRFPRGSGTIGKRIFTLHLGLSLPLIRAKPFFGPSRAQTKNLKNFPFNSFSLIKINSLLNFNTVYYILYNIQC